MASCTLQDWSWEEPGAPCCLAGPICLTRSGCFDTTWGFPSPNWHAANGCILALTQSTTRSSAQRISPFLSPVSFRSRQDGRFTSPCSCIGWQSSSEGTPHRVSGICAAETDAQSHGYASEHGLSREGVVSKQSTAYRRRRCRGSVLWNSQGTHLHQIADYLAQEQLQRSYS